MLSKLKTVATVAMFAAITATSSAAIAGPLKNSTAAPEFTGIEKWLNSDPLTVQQLRGKVVLIDFWTYTCINCINTLPYVKSWNQKYGYFKSGVGNAAYEACGLKGEKSSLPAMRNSTVRMVLKLAYPRALRLAA